MTQAEHLEEIRQATVVVAERLKAATDDGVSHAVILPQMVLAFRESFGELPDGVGLPMLPGMLG